MDIATWIASWFPLETLVFGVLSYHIVSHSYGCTSEMQQTIYLVH